jgi:hypothetical protein
MAAFERAHPHERPETVAPSTRAIVGATFSTLTCRPRIDAAPGAMRSAYDSMRETPCVWMPKRSPRTRMRAGGVGVRAREAERRERARRERRAAPPRRSVHRYPR